MTECCPFALLCAAGQTIFHHCTFCLTYLVTAPVQSTPRPRSAVARVVVPYVKCPSVRCPFFVNPTPDIGYRDHCPDCVQRHDVRLVNWVEVTRDL